MCVMRTRRATGGITVVSTELSGVTHIHTDTRAHTLRCVARRAPSAHVLLVRVSQWRRTLPSLRGTCDSVDIRPPASASDSHHPHAST